jgi:hypothetical protein
MGIARRVSQPMQVRSVGPDEIDAKLLVTVAASPSTESGSSLHRSEMDPPTSTAPHLDGSGLERLTDDPASDDQAVLSPDGKVNSSTIVGPGV